MHTSTRAFACRSLSGQLICVIGLLVIVPAAFAQLEPVWSQEHEAGSIHAVDFSPNSMLLAASSDDSATLWDVSTQSSVATLEHDIIGYVLGVKFSPSGTMLVSITVEYDETFNFIGSKLYLWDVNSAQLIKTLEHSGKLSAVSFSPDDSLLATGDVHGNVQLWNVASGITFSLRLTGSVNSLAFSPDGTLLAGAAAHFRLWEVSTRSVVTTIEEEGFETRGVTVAFSPDGTVLLTGGTLRDLAIPFGGVNTVLDFWEVGTGNRVGERLVLGENILIEAEFSPDGQYISSGLIGLGDSGLLGILELWEVNTQSHKVTVEFASNIPSSIAFSNDGAFLAIGGAMLHRAADYGRIDVWDTQALLAGGTDADNEFPSAKSLLLGHYPNPVYGHAVVTYTLPFTSHVRLTVFDLLGREVEVLANQVQSAGNHRVTFAPEQLPGGIYFYRLDTGKEQVIRSMTIR